MTFSALDSALVGPLFATAAMRRVFAAEATLAAMLAAEAALAEAEAALGLVPPELAPALRRIDPQSLGTDTIGAASAIAGVPTIPFVKEVEARLPAHLAAALHKGATTQDILDTALVLQIRAALDLVAADLERVIAPLADLAAAQKDTPCVGRTYGQHAAPVSFGFKAAVWATGIAEVADMLPGVRRAMLAASLAGPVGTLAALGGKGPGVLERYAGILGLAADPIAWHTRRARIARCGAFLVMLVGALAKMAGDIAHLASTEVGEVAEPHVPGRGGSSAMPHKRNPVGCTVILAAHAAAKGLFIPLADAMAAQHERPVGAWHGEWHALPQLFGLASGALAEAAVLAEGLVVDAARMGRNLALTRGLLFADAAAALLAPALGRQQAHDLVERAAEAVRQGAPSLLEALAAMPETAAIDLARAFALEPAVEAAALWTDRALDALSARRSALEAGGAGV